MALFVVIFSVVWTVVVSAIGIRAQLRSVHRVRPLPPPLRPGPGPDGPSVAEEAERWLRLQADH
jgi:hypothetical protein